MALVIGVLLAGSVVSAVIYGAERRAENRHLAQIMDRYTDEVTVAIGDRVSRYGEAMNDLAAAVGAQSDLRRADFIRASSGLGPARLPGSSGITFVVPSSTAQTGELQRYWRAQGSTDLTLTPAPGHERHRYVVFDRAFDSGGSVLGLDLVTSPQPNMAMDLAVRSDQLAISNTYQLLRDRHLAPQLRQNSVALAVPVRSGDQDLFTGWLVMGVRGQDFLSQTLLDRGQSAVQVSLVDPAGADKVIATAHPGHRVTDTALTRERDIVVGQRPWSVTIWPTTALLRSSGRGMSELTAAAGMALTLMLAVLIGVLAGSRNRAFRQVEQATAELRRDRAQLHHMAFHDQLTGLANRQLFYERLTHAVDGRADGDDTVAVLFIDLDGFKQINDARGHQAGDLVLRTVAERLRAGLRSEDTVARFGGDEFAAVLESLAGLAEARAAAERIITDVQRPIDVAGVSASVSASIGVAVHRPGLTVDDLIRDADAAMYAAKAAGKNRYLVASSG
ncbi:diguanylate cyclase domain-containing protein [Paractinoplanes durhamensis]|uniref:diguanylate cyclase domain-containing protein n=1 Tax=Paractinoplanes durhamensis TaxID=113563 RepID=UPI001942058C|nr:diguanylate cyclase [Actinoplanes durhamensis]